MAKLINILKLEGLKPLKNLTVNTKTKESCNELMRVYELGGWKWDSLSIPTRGVAVWGIHKEKTCIDAGFSHLYIEEGLFGFSSRTFYLEEYWKIISPQKFYRVQGINSQMLKEINEYFEKKK